MGMNCAILKFNSIFDATLSKNTIKKSLCSVCDPTREPPNLQTQMNIAQSSQDCMLAGNFVMRSNTGGNAAADIGSSMLVKIV